MKKVTSVPTPFLKLPTVEKLQTTFKNDNLIVPEKSIQNQPSLVFFPYWRRESVNQKILHPKTRLTGPGFDHRISREAINEVPLQRWQGPVHILATESQLAEALQRLRKEPVLGFDTETRPAFKKGQSYRPALLQLATAEEVFLVQLPSLGLPEPLRHLLADTSIIKAGVSLAYDIKELQKLAPFTEGGFIDLGHEAKQLGIKNHGLRGLCAVLLGFRISKSSQTSNWSKKKLTPAQISYAATDAWVGRELYFTLQALKNQGQTTEASQPERMKGC